MGLSTTYTKTETDFLIQQLEIKTNSASQIFDESGLSQQALNNGVESIIQLRLTNPKMEGNSVFLASANLNQNQGGGRFVATQKAGLVDNGGTIISSANPELYWVRVDYDRITPEMFGAGLEIEDNTDPLERFLKCCGDGYHGTAEANKKYKITRPIITTYSKSVNIDFNGATIQPEWNIVSGTVDETIKYSSSTGGFVENISVNISNVNFDLTKFTPVVSTTGENRKGIRGLTVVDAESINISNYKCKGAFYGSGLYLYNYRYATLDGIHLPDCGMKINPNGDDTGVYDAAGDGLYLGAIKGHGLTNISNIHASSQAGYFGRAGIAIEQFANDTLSHLVTLNNADFDGYHRILHQEDHGVSRIVWNNGSAKNFSNMLYNLDGKPDINYLDATNIKIEVNPDFAYGGTSGINNFQNFGDMYLNNCDIEYLVNVQERGNKFISGGTLKLNNAVVDHAVSSKTHTLTNVKTTSTGGSLFYTAFNKGVNISGGSLNGVAGSLTNIIRSFNSAININSGCKLQDCSLFGENTLPIGEAKNVISDSEITYTGSTTGVLFNGSYDSAYKLSNVKIKSNSARLELYGDGRTRYSIHDSELLNTGINAINTGATNVNGILKVRGCELYYSDKYGLTSPISNSFGSVYAVFSDNILFDATTAQNMAFPSASATTKLDSNHIARGGSIT